MRTGNVGTNIRSNAKLRFFTKNETIVLDSDTVNGDILSVTTQKDLASSAHQFTIVLSPRIIKAKDSASNSVYIPDLIKPYDLVEISFKTDSAGYKVEMIGFVSRAAIQLTVLEEGGKPQRTLEISGFGLAKALQNAKIFFNPTLNINNFAGMGGQLYYGTQQVDNLLTSVNVKDFVKNFVSQAFTNTFDNANSGSPYYSFTFGGRKGYSRPYNAPSSETQGIKITDLVDFQNGMSTMFENNKINNPFILLDMGAGEEVSVWDVIKSYSDPPFHECFIDLRRSGTDAEKAHSIQSGLSESPLVFYLRTTPFSPDSWHSLKSHFFFTSDVMSQNTATSEENIYNYFHVICSNDSTIIGAPQLAAAAYGTQDYELGRCRVPILDTESILKYGFRQFPIQTTKYVDFISQTIPGIFNTTNPNDQAVIMAVCTLARQLLRWYAFGEDFETGTIVLKGRVGIGSDGATIGSKLIERNPDGSTTGKEFYIEGVTQQWQVGRPLTTSLSVSRGHFPAAHFDYSGSRVLGRFEKVSNLCKDLHLSQNSFCNSELFHKVEPEDYGASTAYYTPTPEGGA